MGKCNGVCQNCQDTLNDSVGHVCQQEEINQYTNEEIAYCVTFEIYNVHLKSQEVVANEVLNKKEERNKALIELSEMCLKIVNNH